MPASAGEQARWRSLLTGEQATEAMAVVHAIAEDLPKHLPPNSSAPPALMAGAAGLAVFYAYLSNAAGGEDRYASLAAAYADAAIDASASLDEADADNPLGARSFCNGVAGVGWAMEHLRGLLWDASEEPNEATDEIIGALLANGASALPRYELLYGLVGQGAYALERLAHGGDVALCERVLAVLEARAQSVASGTTWLTPRKLVFERDRTVATSDGLYDLGVAHGVPGVLALLASLHHLEPLRSRVERLIRGTVSWLRTQRLPERAGAHYPYAIGAGPSAEPATHSSRAAWCYGDPAIALTLHRAAIALGDEALEREALSFARSAAERADELCGVVDAGLCHGAAGLALIFGRLSQGAPEDGSFADAARRWAKNTLSMRRPDTGVGGYLTYHPTPDGQPGWRPSTGLLTGAAGIGLSLLALTTDQEPRWDRCLLLSGLSGSEAA